MEKLRFDIQLGSLLSIGSHVIERQARMSFLRLWQHDLAPAGYATDMGHRYVAT